MLNRTLLYMSVFLVVLNRAKEKQRVKRESSEVYVARFILQEKDHFASDETKVTNKSQ